MIKKLTFLALIAIGGIILSAAQAQDVPPGAPAPAPAPETPVEKTAQEGVAAPPAEDPAAIIDFSTIGPKNNVFEEKFKEWKSFLSVMHKLKLEYQTASSARQAEIEKDYLEKIKTGESKQKEMFQLALDAFDEGKGKNDNVNNLLMGMLDFEFNRDNYEKCFAVASKLLEVIPEKTPYSNYVHACGGVSAMMIMELDKAEQWLKAAEDAGFLGEFLQNTDRKFTPEYIPLMIAAFRKSWPIEQEIRKKESEAPDDAKNPIVLLKTNKGDIKLELFENQAPNTVANFISLIEKGFYKDVVFHRVLPGFMAQGGDPSGTGGGGPGYTFDCECYKPEARKHFRGTLSMAKTLAPNTNGSQFFLTFIPTTPLDGKHTVFGRVIEGIEVLSELQRIDPEEKGTDVLPDKILEAKVISKRNHEYVPVVKPDPKF